MKFGDRLKQLRLEKTITQNELGDAIEISGRVIGYYESGDRFPNEDVLKNIANYFDVSVDYLLGMDDCHKINIKRDLKDILVKLELDDGIYYEDYLLNEKDKEVFVKLINNVINIIDIMNR